MASKPRSFWSTSQARHLAEIAGLIDGGKLRTRVGAVLPLADAREAHFMLERVRPQPKGKIVTYRRSKLSV